MICAGSGLCESGIGDDLGDGSGICETVRINDDEKSGICESEVKDGLGEGSGICETVRINGDEKSGICEVGDDGGEESGICETVRRNDSGEESRVIGCESGEGTEEPRERDSVEACAGSCGEDHREPMCFAGETSRARIKGGG